jgi:hypothetical protein
VSECSLKIQWDTTKPTQKTERETELKSAYNRRDKNSGQKIGWKYREQGLEIHVKKNREMRTDTGLLVHYTVPTKFSSQRE